MSDATPACVTSQQQGDIAVFHIQQTELRDADTAYRLRDAMVGQIDATEAEHAVIDLSNVQFVGSIGFLAFMSMKRRLSGGKIVLCGLSPTVREMFQVCGLLGDNLNAAAFLEAGDKDQAIAIIQS